MQLDSASHPLLSQNELDPQVAGLILQCSRCARCVAAFMLSRSVSLLLSGGARDADARIAFGDVQYSVCVCVCFLCMCLYVLMSVSVCLYGPCCL